MAIEPRDIPFTETDPFGDIPEDGSRPEQSFSIPTVDRRLQGSGLHDFQSSRDMPGIVNIEIPAHWAVPWSDLMMVMMVMFAVMFVTKLAERDVGELFRKETQTQPQPQPQPPTPKLEKADQAPVPIQDILRLSEKLVTEANLEDIDVVLTGDQAVKVSVRGNLLFDLGKADLKPEAITFLDRLAGVIAANNFKIEVAGHTDNFPISNPAYPTNWELSSARAARVARYLIQAGNIEPARFTILGHAFYQPTVPNTTLENKAKNRRVEIIITRNEYKSLFQ